MKHRVVCVCTCKSLQLVIQVILITYMYTSFNTLIMRSNSKCNTQFCQCCVQCTV